MGAPVTWFEITSHNSVGLRDFYAQTFGWQMQPMEGGQPYAVVDTGGDGGISGGIGDAANANRVTFYIAVDDPQAYLDRIEQAGGRIVIPLTVVPDVVTFALFADPEGNVIGLTTLDSMAGATLLIEYRVDDPVEWRRIFDADPLDRRSHGATGQQIQRDADDDRHLMVSIEFGTAGEARAFRDLPALRQVWEISGAGRSWVLVPAESSEDR